MLELIVLASLCSCACKPYDVTERSRPMQVNDKEKAEPEQLRPDEIETAVLERDYGETETAALEENIAYGESAHEEFADMQVIQAAGYAEGDQSLMWLRDRIDFPQTMFGAAYFGYFEEIFEGDVRAGVFAKMLENNQAMMQKYPFIAEIDADHIVGNGGFLYCIVPADENATIAINRIQWNATTYTYDPVEVLYRSESGEPVLLFANVDGVAYEADTQIFITDNNGNTCEWQPSLDGMSRLAPWSETGEAVLFDFTEYGWFDAPSELVPWLGEGWTGMTALGLSGWQDTGTGWITNTTAWDTGSIATFYLWFYPGDGTGGRVDLDWIYSDSDEYEEMWSGFWTIQTIPDGPSYVTISLSLVGGRNYGVTDGPMYISEMYPALISPGGTELLLGNGIDGICMPFMSPSKTGPYEFTLIE